MFDRTGANILLHFTLVVSSSAFSQYNKNVETFCVGHAVATQEFVAVLVNKVCFGTCETIYLFLFVLISSV